MGRAAAGAEPQSFDRFAADLRRHGLQSARWLLRFHTSAPWLDHLASDRYLSRRAFEQR